MFRLAVGQRYETTGEKARCYENIIHLNLNEI